ncbi:MAG: HAMP domain-containing protein [Candidatus Saganbacteria bacterium]|nr:HAMP domain-containing protein [Candidatus Saganbacteria bacterium]
MKINKLGLLMKFAVSVSALIILTSVLLSIILLGVERGRTVAEIKGKGEALAQNLAFNSEYGILSGNIDALDRLVNALIQEKDVVYVQILSAKGAVLAKGEKGEIKPGIYNIEVPVKSFEVKRSPEEIGMEPMAGGLKKGKEHLVGGVKVGISLERANLIVAQLAGIFSVITLIVILLGIVLLILSMRYLLILPLRKFVNATRVIASGDLTGRAEIESDDEIGELAGAFNSMVLDLKSAKENLEGRVAGGTGELQKSFEASKKIRNQLEEANKRLEGKVGELEGFQDLAVGRELKMAELEKEVNSLLAELGREPKYGKGI